MAETVDDLSAPLGQDMERRKRRVRLPFTAMQLLACLLGLFLLTFAGFALFSDNPLGGEPVVRVAIRHKASEEKSASSAAAASHTSAEKAAPAQAVPGEQKTVTIIDGSSGKRQDVLVGGGAEKGAGDPATPPAMMTGIDQRLLEKTRYGMIPIIADGLKSFTVYAADADRAKAAKMPVVSIVVGGLGVGAAKTTEAIM
jgi:hypothetical protein